MKKTKIVLGMSGGVDSSVCAYLLKKQGYEVIGLFMQNWDTYLNNDILGHTSNHDEQCNVQKDFNDAKKVADKLNIKIHRVEFVEKYWKNVFKYLIDEYKSARTPNPDILCNKYIKFGEFIDYAKKKFNTNLIAMGHYANTKDGKLLMAKDNDKDQTYFLCWLNKEQLKQTKFPIGNLSKQKVRSIAKEIGLDNWNRKDSTGICFIGERKFKDFLSNYLTKKPGKIIDIETKNVVGQHQGVMFYTYGQNKGLSLSGVDKRYFVCKKDAKKNILYVCGENSKNRYLSSSSCEAIKFNWISPPPTNKHVMLRFRHRQPLINGTFKIQKNKVSINYSRTLSVTPGQFVVMYQRNECLGGGIVDKVK